MSVKGFSVKALTYSSVCIALAVILSNVKLYRMPQGGSVTAFSMLFISLIGYMFGGRVGVTAGAVHGLIQLAFGATIVHPVQLLLEYPIAFGFLGLSGVVRDKRHGLYTGYILGVLGRLFCSTLAGIVFFGEYTPAGDNVIIYSLVYNLSYLAPEAFFTLLILGVPTVREFIRTLSSDKSRAC